MEKKEHKVTKKTFIFAITFEIGLIILGSILLYMVIERKITCTEKVMATIVAINERTELTGDVATVKYYPTLSYEYDGETYETGTAETVSHKTSIGTQVEIYVNPNNPKSILVSGGRTIILGSFLVAFGVAFLIPCLINMKKKWRTLE